MCPIPPCRRSPAGRRRGPAPAHRATAMRSHASSRAPPRIWTISSNSSGPATSGGEICTGSPRSSARQIRPRLNSSGRGSRAGAHRTRRRKALTAVRVLDELERVEVAAAAQVADDRELEQPAEGGVELVLPLGDVRDDAVAAHDLDVADRHGRLHRSGRGAAVVNIQARPIERLDHAVANEQGADRGIGGGQPLRRRDHVGPDVEALRREPVAEAAEARDHLVGAERDAVAVAQFAHARPVAGRRHGRPARVLHRLHDHHRDRLGAGLANRLLRLVEQEAVNSSSLSPSGRR